MTHTAIAADVHQDDVTAHLNQQMKAEIGEDELTADEINQLRQKYGLVPAKFTAWELQFIEGRKAA